MFNGGVRGGYLRKYILPFHSKSAKNKTFFPPSYLDFPIDMTRASPGNETKCHRYVYSLTIIKKFPRLSDVLLLYLMLDPNHPPKS